MALITPSISTISPVLTATLPTYGVSGSVSYSQFLQSLGKYNYGAEFFYLFSTSFVQIGQPFTYNHFDANGNSVTTALPFAIDPYQSRPAVYYETEPDQIILTGLSSMQFTMFANTTMYMKFYATIEYLGNELDDMGAESGDNLFEEIEMLKGIKFFDDYCNYIIDNDGYQEATDTIYDSQ